MTVTLVELTDSTEVAALEELIIELEELDKETGPAILIPEFVEPSNTNTPLDDFG